MMVAKTHKETLKLEDLTLDKSVQMRAAMNRIALADYFEAMKRGDRFPPIHVFYIFGGANKRYVADGFHRVIARRRAGLKTIEAIVHHGGKREAILFAAGANRVHGVRITNDDKRKAVCTLLLDKEWKQWVNTEIAKACGVSEGMVRAVRAWIGELAEADKVNGKEQRRFRDKSGTRRKITINPNRDKEREDILHRQLQDETTCPYCGQKMPKKQGAGK